MKKVLLLGDSIRLAYQHVVIKEMGDRAFVWGPEENGRFAKYTLYSLRRYFSQYPAPEVIHWNNGLWDTEILNEEDGCFTPVAEYVRDLRLILKELKQTGASIIFATTTPVSPLNMHDGEYRHYNVNIKEYNNRACELMQSEGVAVNDLFSFVYPHIKEYIGEDHLHLSPAGEIACGKLVAASISRLLEAN